MSVEEIGDADDPGVLSNIEAPHDVQRRGEVLNHPLNDDPHAQFSNCTGGNQPYHEFVHRKKTGLFGHDGIEPHTSRMLSCLI